MQVVKEFKSIGKYPWLEVVLFVPIFGGVDYGGLLAIPRIFSLAVEAAGAEVAFLMWANIGLIIIFLFAVVVIVWLNIVFIWGFAEAVRLVGMRMIVLDEGLKICGRSREAFVPNSSIVNTWRSENGRSFWILWQGKKRLRTFVISEKIFGKGAVDQADSIMSARNGYIDDKEQIKQIREDILSFWDILLPFKSLCDIADGIERHAD
jgi:hypothetical protein